MARAAPDDRSSEIPGVKGPRSFALTVTFLPVFGLPTRMQVPKAMGGAHARLTAAQSVSALRRLIETLRPAQSGRFFNDDGREYAW